MSPSLVRRTQAALPHVQIWNLYGPTETTSTSTVWRVTEGTPVSIGRPIANTQVYVLDDKQRPTPIGVVGELYIGGAGVARGYLNRPELTAEKFVVDGFSSAPNAKLYRTADRARWLSDGNLEFLGRDDDQIKIRGVRIEPGEIEAALTAHSRVGQCAVLLREDRPNDKRLVAYCVSTSETKPTASDLRNYLRERLPVYMVPTAFVDVAAIPLTVAGKVDRRALPVPNSDSLVTQTDYVAPRNVIEQLLMEIWCEVLDLDISGIHDDFFELGGHSLLATQIVSRVEDRLQMAVPLRKVFECPTIAELAAELLEQLVQGLEDETLEGERAAS